MSIFHEDFKIIFEIPKRFKNSSFSNYLTDFENHKERESAKQSCVNYANNSDIFKTGECLLLIGKTGTGKTHLSCAIANFLSEHGKSAGYVSAYQLVSISRSGKKSQIIDITNQYDLLIIDDLDILLKPTNIINQIITSRYNENKPTISIIGKLSKINKYIGGSCIDKLMRGDSQTVIFDWESHRRLNRS